MEGVTNFSGCKLMRPYAEVFASNVHASHLHLCSEEWILWQQSCSARA